MEKNMNWFKSLLSKVIYFLVFITLVGVGFEYSLRFYTRDVEKSLWKTAMMDHVQHRIDRIWDRGRDNKEIFWGPPYNIFWNQGLEDKERMKLIYNHSILPKSGDWVTPNFLRKKEEKKDHSFRVKTNSLGFRDIERTVEKGPNTKRVIVLGSYPAFGHGVSNEETYSFQIESLLREKHPNLNIEVWNGGQQGTVAIMGYARMKLELEKYQPDLIIFDYGWVDFYMRQDQTLEASKIPTWKKPHWTFFQKLASKIRFEWLPRTSISKIIDNKAKESFRKVNWDQWEKVMDATVNFSQKKQIPILYLRHHREAIWRDLYKKYNQPDKGQYFVDTSFAIDEKNLTDEIVEDFWSKSNWLTELGKTKGTTPRKAEIYFRGDALMFNKHGHKAIAEYLLPTIEKIVIP